MNMPSFVFFGTPPFAVTILEALKKQDLLPGLIVTAPDKPQGRGMKLTPPAVKVWADEHNIPTIQPATLKEETSQELQKKWDYFVVAAYGKIIPQSILDLPKKKTLNVHPSLLPKYRGASPIESQILHDEQPVGVTIMEMDAELDHGPILLQEETKLPTWPMKKDALTHFFALQGGKMLIQALTNPQDGTPQDHALATFTRKIEKKDGQLNLNHTGYDNYLKFCAYHPWPGTFFFAKKDGKKVRIKINDAVYGNNTFTPTKVTPEGRGSLLWDEFVNAGFEY